MSQEIMERNETAYTLGFACGMFGLWGIAHLYMGRIGAGLVKMIIMAPVHLIISAVACCGFVTIPWAVTRWFRLAQEQANEGALVQKAG